MKKSKILIANEEMNSIKNIQAKMELFKSDFSGTKNIIESTELGESLKELNLDDRDPIHKMSGIDMRTRLHPIEIAGLLAIDTLVTFKFIPDRCLQFTRQKKRLAVSIHGKGRSEIVDIVAGKREHDVKKNISFGDRISGFMNPNNKTQ